MKPSWRTRMVLVAVGITAGVGAWAVHTGRLGRHRAPVQDDVLYGNVEVRQVDLGFRVAGRLKAMYLEEGQAVTAGTVLATLDDRPFQDTLHAADAEVAVQEATVHRVMAGARPAELARARAVVEEATAAENNARTALARAQRLVSEGAVPRATLDDVVAASQMADARLDGALEARRLLAQGTRAEDVAVARAAWRAAQARRMAAQTALDDTRLVAPSDGVVTSRVHEPGAMMSPNDVAYVLSLTHAVWVRAYVSETQLGRVHPGMSVWVSGDAAPGHPWRGRVGYVSPTAEFTPRSVETPDLRTELVYRIRVVVDAPGQGLQQGMPVTVRIPTTAVGR